MVRNLFLACCLASLAAACGSSETPLGSVTVGTITLEIGREGDAPDPGKTPTFVFKPTAGGNPTSITGWVGIASGAGSTKTLAVYDSADGDFDDDITIPSPLPAGSMLYFDVDINGVVVTGSIALK